MTREGVRTQQAARFILVMGSLGFLFCVCSSFSRQMLEELFDPGLSLAMPIEQPAGVVGSCTTSRAVPAASNEAAPPALVGTPIAMPSTPISPDAINSLTRFANWGPGVVNDIAWSARHDLVAIASAYGITLYDSAFRLVRTLEQPAAVIRVVFFPDGRRLAWQESDQRVRIWQVDGGAPLSVTKPHGTLRSDTFGPRHQTIRTWQMPGFRFLHEFKTGPIIGDLAFSADRQSLAATAGNGVTAWNLVTGEERFVTTSLSWLQEDVAFTPDGALVVSSGSDQTLRFWRATDGTLLRTLDAHRHTIYSNLLRFALPADGRFIVTGSSDGTIGIWGSPVP